MTLPTASLLLMVLIPGAVQSDREEYEFQAKLTGIGMLSDSKKPVYATNDADSKWYV